MICIWLEVQIAGTDNSPKNKSLLDNNLACVHPLPLGFHFISLKKACFFVLTGMGRVNLHDWMKQKQ